MEPTKYDIERAFYRILDNGDEAAIAKEIGHSAGYVSQLYSPDNERESTLVRAIRELRAWRRESIERGSHALDVFIQFVERDLEGEDLCVIDETKKLKRQGTDTLRINGTEISKTSGTNAGDTDLEGTRPISSRHCPRCDRGEEIENGEMSIATAVHREQLSE